MMLEYALLQRTTRCLLHPTRRSSSNSFLRRCSPPIALSSLSIVERNGNSSSSSTRGLLHHHHHQQQQQQQQQQYVQCRFKSVFVSRHNFSLHVTAPIILDYLKSHGVLSSNNNAASAVRTTTSHVILQECPFCPKPTNGQADNQYKLYIQLGGGAFFCHRCGAGGSWFDLKHKLGGGGGSNGSNSDNNSNNVPVSIADSMNYNYSGGGPPAPPRGGSGGSNSQYRAGGGGGGGGATGTSPYDTKMANLGQQQHAAAGFDGGATVPCLPMPPPRLQAVYSTDLFTNDDNDENDTTTSTKMNPVLQYLVHTRGLSTNTLRKYGVGRAKYAFSSQNGEWVHADCVTFSWIMSLTDIEYQESLRGAKFVYKEQPQQQPNNKTEQKTSTTTTTPPDTSSNDTDASDAASPEETLSLSDDTPSSKDKKENVDDTNFKDFTYVTRRIKARALCNKAWQRLDPPGGAWGFFGYHTVPRGAKEVVLTEGEYDAMAVWQATGKPAISLPNGCRSLPVEALPMLEEFDKIYLWMDNDGPGQEGAELFTRKIGLERCYIVRPTLANCRNIATATTDGDSIAQQQLPKDANDALLMGLDLSRILQDAKLTPHERILTFDDLRDDVLHEIMHPDQYVGVPLPSLPKFTNIIAGLRRGELTVITGPTGSGKTTFLGQMSLDLAEQDVNVLWGSFEIKNTRLMHKLLQQFAREPLPRGGEADSNRLYALADRFAQLPLHFLKFHGGSDVDDVLDAMEYAVYVNDVQHIILDNMQFMISRQSTASGKKSSSWDKFDVQDVAVEKFRHFATERNVHVTLVVHPKKEQEAQRLNISSVYGSAKATQEADTVIIIQHDGDRKFLDVKKNRFNGDLGHAALHFDRQSGRYTEEPLINGKRLMPKLHPPQGSRRTDDNVEEQEGLLDPKAVRRYL